MSGWQAFNEKNEKAAPTSWPKKNLDNQVRQS